MFVIFCTVIFNIIKYALEFLLIFSHYNLFPKIKFGKKICIFVYTGQGESLEARK